MFRNLLENIAPIVAENNSSAVVSKVL